MTEQSLGLIETIGLTAAVEAADAAVKAANVTLVGYELAKGEGMTVVKLLGEVGAIKAAVSAGAAAAGRVNRVVSVNVIARPARDVSQLVNSPETVGIAAQPRPVETPAKVEAEKPETAPVGVNDEGSDEAIAASGPETPKTEVLQAEPVNDESTEDEAAGDETDLDETAKTETTAELETSGDQPDSEPEPEPDPGSGSQRSGSRNRRRQGSSRRK
ncbi:BMC domain-containing protein [Breoghania sp. JC706]